MSLLWIELPLVTPGPEVRCAVAPWHDKGGAPEWQSLAMGDGLPATAALVVLPASAVSWHSVTLPPGLERKVLARQEALRSLLEDQLLQDPASLHLALSPGWQAGSPAWVAACDRTWLQAWLQALRAAGLRIQQILPALAPRSVDLQAWCLGDEDSGMLWLESSTHGVWGVPARALREQDWASILPPGLALAGGRCDAAAGAWASDLLGDRVQLAARGADLPAILAEGWGLAQFDLKPDRAGVLGGLQLGLRALWVDRQWRGVRWALLTLLATPLLLAPAWALAVRWQWQDQQAQWAQVLRQTFPETPVVLDAPAQMQQQVLRLQRRMGVATPSDLETQLSALGQRWPEGMQGPEEIDYAQGRLTFRAPHLSVANQPVMSEQLQAQGWTLRWNGHQGQLHWHGSTP